MNLIKRIIQKLFNKPDKTFRERFKRFENQMPIPNLETPELFQDKTYPIKPIKNSAFTSEPPVQEKIINERKQRF